MAQGLADLIDEIIEGLWLQVRRRHRGEATVGLTTDEADIAEVRSDQRAVGLVGIDLDAELPKAHAVADEHVFETLTEKHQGLALVKVERPGNGNRVTVESAADLTETLRKLAGTGHLVIASHHQLETVGVCYDLALVMQREQIAFGPVATVMENAEVRETLSLERRVRA